MLIEEKKRVVTRAMRIFGGIEMLLTSERALRTFVGPVHRERSYALALLRGEKEFSS